MGAHVLPLDLPNTRPGARLRPVLMKRDDVINLERAAFQAKRSTDTIRRWCRKHAIARQSCPNAPLEISAIGLEMVLHNDLEALELLRQGQRSHPDVQRYIDHLGLPG